MNWKNDKGTCKKLGYNYEETSDGYAVNDGTVRYSIFYLEGFNKVIISPSWYKDYYVGNTWYSKKMDRDIPNIEGEIKNYIASTTNNIVWTFERASEVAWQVKLNGPKVQWAVTELIKNNKK